MSSITVPSETNTNEDCVNLHRAVGGWRCDTETVIRILTQRNSDQRTEIRKMYKDLYKEDLCKRFQSKLDRYFYLFNHFEKAVLMWMRDAPERNAMILQGALRNKSGLQRNCILAEVLFMQNMEEVKATADAYHGLYDDRLLQNEIEGALSGSCQELFVSYLGTNRNEGPDFARPSVEDVINLHKGLFTDINDTAVIQILTSRNRKALCNIFAVYKNTYQNDVHQAIDEMDENHKNEFTRTVMVIAKCISNTKDYFAEVLYASMIGLGTRDEILIRIIVTHAEVDLANIKAAFFRKYKQTLSAMVRSDTTFDYRKFLLALIGTP